VSVRQDYQPGICNIGSEEIRRRVALGWAALGGTVALWAALLLIAAPAGWFVLVFLPAFGAALGFVQAAFRFCVYFGFAARFNFGGGRAEKIASAAARRRDRRAALRILMTSFVIAGGVALVAYGTALMR
jgi:hypothetical protein